MDLRSWDVRGHDIFQRARKLQIECPPLTVPDEVLKSVDALQ
jgi:hypothetical protein